MRDLGRIGFVFALLLSIPLAFSGTLGTTSSPSNQTGFFLGVGGGYNAVRSTVDTSGILSATAGMPPLGTFAGKMGSSSHTQRKFAPEVQAGYLQHINHSDWLWGFEFLYQYSRIKHRIQDHSWSAGAGLNLLNTTQDTADELRISAIQTRVRDEFALPIFIGHSFTNSFLYLGAGPSLFNTKYNMYSSSDELSGYYIGVIDGFSNSKWVWGSTIQAGMAYYLNPSWFLKLNYAYSVTGKHKTKNAKLFLAELNGGLNDGLVLFKTSQRITAQEIALSINKVFSL